MTFATPPATEKELLDNAGAMTGMSLRQIAGMLGLQVPLDQKKAKGWVGRMIELFLGATAASLPEPDFQQIGVELKTLPVDQHRKPKETTFVCTVPLGNNAGQTWDNSTVKRKLKRVLWVPVEAEPSIPLAQRRIGKPFIWSPDRRLESALRADWQELMDMVSMGELDRVNSRQGRYLQIRPKAANAKVLAATTMATGETALTLPRGFYLRPAFTLMLLERHGQF